MTRWILDHSAGDKRKTVFAAALLAIMAVMWFRALTGREPGPAAAAPGAPAEQAGPQKSGPRFTFVDLPSVPGRNDYINRDFFAVRDWECFRQNAAPPRTGTDTEVHIASPNHAQEVAARIAEKLTLEAVLRWGDNPQVFIDDRLLSVGDRFTVRDGPDTCEFEVLGIHEDSVLVGCNGTRLTLKLAQYRKVSK